MKEVTMEQLTEIIKGAITGMLPEHIESLKKEILEVNKKSIFPAGDQEMLESSGKSVVDTSFFTKNFRDRFSGRLMNGDQMGRILSAAGGPWMRLSPAMDKFAHLCRMGADPMKMMSTGMDIRDYNKFIREADKVEQKDTATGMTTTDAGALVPIEFLATVVEFATMQSAILPKLWRLPMGSATLRIPRLAQSAGSYFGGITLYHPGEAGQKTETKPSLDYLTFTAKKLIGIIPLSDETIADSAINMINYITGLFVRAFQYQTENEVVNGTGLNDQMTGILSDTGINLVPRQTVLQVKYDDVINLESALDENFSDLTFLSRRATVNTLRKQKDVNGDPIYRDGVVGAVGSLATPHPPQLIGYPVIKTRNTPALGAQGDLTLGDLGYYLWAMRQEMTIDTSKDARFFYDQTVLRFVIRQDGKPGIPIAFATLDNVPES